MLFYVLIRVDSCFYSPIFYYYQQNFLQETKYVFIVTNCIALFFIKNLLQCFVHVIKQCATLQHTGFTPASEITSFCSLYSD